MERKELLDLKIILTKIDSSMMDMKRDNEDLNEGTGGNGNEPKRPKLAEAEDENTGRRSSDETEVDSDDENSEQVETMQLRRRRNGCKTPLTPLRRIAKTKKMMKLCNLNVVNYDEFWKDCSTAEQKIQRMLDYMKENGLKGKPTISKCYQLGKLMKEKNQKKVVVNDAVVDEDQEIEIVPDIPSTATPAFEGAGSDESASTDSCDSGSSGDSMDSMTDNPVDNPVEESQVENTTNPPTNDDRAEANLPETEVQGPATAQNETETTPGGITTTANEVNQAGVNVTMIGMGSPVQARPLPNITNNTNIIFGSPVSRNHLCIRRPLDGSVVPNTPVIGAMVADQVTIRCGGRNLPPSQGNNNNNIMMNNTPNIRVMQFATNPVRVQNVVRGDMRPMVPTDHSVCRVVGFANAVNAVPNSYLRMPDNVMRGVVQMGPVCMGPRIPVCYTNTRIPSMPRPNVGIPRNCGPTPTLTYPYSGSHQGQQPPNPLMVMRNHNDALERINTLLGQICPEGVMQEGDVDFLRNYRNEIRRRISRIEATGFLEKLIEYESNQARPDQTISQKLKTLLAALRNA